MVKWVSGFWGARPGLRCAAAPARLWGSAASCKSDAAAADGGPQARSAQASYAILLLTQLACFLRRAECTLSEPFCLPRWYVCR